VEATQEAMGVFFMDDPLGAAVNARRTLQTHRLLWTQVQSVGGGVDRFFAAVHWIDAPVADTQAALDGLHAALASPDSAPELADLAQFCRQELDAATLMPGRPSVEIGAEGAEGVEGVEGVEAADGVNEDEEAKDEEDDNEEEETEEDENARVMRSAPLYKPLSWLLAKGRGVQLPLEAVASLQCPDFGPEDRAALEEAVGFPLFPVLDSSSSSSSNTSNTSNTSSSTTTSSTGSTSTSTPSTTDMSVRALTAVLCEHAELFRVCAADATLRGQREREKAALEVIRQREALAAEEALMAAILSAI
jgi:hypothetical protein